jgi:hypothetical protein
MPSSWNDGGIVAAQSRQERAEGVVASGEDAGDVFPHDPEGVEASSKSKMVNCIADPYEQKSEVAAII